MKLYIIELVLNTNKRKRIPCFAFSEYEAKCLALQYFDRKYKQVINAPSVKLTRLHREYKIRKGVLKR